MVDTEGSNFFSGKPCRSKSSSQQPPPAPCGGCYVLVFCMRCRSVEQSNPSFFVFVRSIQLYDDTMSCVFNLTVHGA